MRNVKIKLTTQSGLISHDTEAVTWVELKEELKDQIDFTKNWRVVVRSTRTTLELDDALLPAEDFILFMYPLKSKAGTTSQEVDNLSYHEARSKAVAAGLSAQGTATEIRERLRDHYDSQVEDSNNEELIEQVEELREHVNAQLSQLAVAISNADLSTIDGQKLQEEFDTVRRSLGL